MESRKDGKVLRREVIETSDDDGEPSLGEEFSSSAQPLVKRVKCNQASMPVEADEVTQLEKKRFLAAHHRVKRQTWLDLVAKEMGQTRQEVDRIYSKIDPAELVHGAALSFPADWITIGPPPPPPPPPLCIPYPRPVRLPPPTLTPTPRRRSITRSLSGSEVRSGPRPGRLLGSRTLHTNHDPRMDESVPKIANELRSEAPRLGGHSR